MQEVGNGVIRHVDCGVTQTLDQEVVIPRQFRAQTVRTSACPFVQPSQNTFETISRFRIVGVHLRNHPIDKREINTGEVR